MTLNIRRSPPKTTLFATSTLTCLHERTSRRVPNLNIAARSRRRRRHQSGRTRGMHRVQGTVRHQPRPRRRVRQHVRGIRRERRWRRQVERRTTPEALVLARLAKTTPRSAKKVTLLIWTVHKPAICWPDEDSLGCGGCFLKVALVASGGT